MQPLEKHAQLKIVSSMFIFKNISGKASKLRDFDTLTDHF